MRSEVLVHSGAAGVRPSQVRALGALTLYPLLAMLRNVSTIAFGFAFPLVFVAVFGLIGSGAGGSFRVGLLSDDPGAPPHQMLTQLPGVAIVERPPSELDRELMQGKLDAVVTLAGSGVIVRINSANSQGQAARLWIQGALDQLNLRAAGMVTPRYSVEVQEVAGLRNRYIDFALPGQIGFALLSTAIFGTVYGLLFLKKALVLKRLFATPVHGLTILLGQGLARLLISLVQTVLILAVGMIAFGYQVADGWKTFLAVLGLASLGLMVFMGMGLLIAGRTNDENAASPLTNLVTLPQFLLSGVFFPTDLFPDWVRSISEVLPLTFFNTALRQVTAEGLGLAEVWPRLVGLGLWGVVCYVAAARTFKWV